MAARGGPVPSVGGASERPTTVAGWFRLRKVPSPSSPLEAVGTHRTPLAVTESTKVAIVLAALSA
jgi:hypothetical protein